MSGEPERQWRVDFKWLPLVCSLCVLVVLIPGDNIASQCHVVGRVSADIEILRE